MQPSPRAETSRLLFPSLRFCIAIPSTNGRRLRRCLCPLFFTPASGRNSFPSAESANEGACVLISEEAGTPSSSNLRKVLPETRKCLFIALLTLERSHVDTEAVLH